MVCKKCGLPFTGEGEICQNCLAKQGDASAPCRERVLSEEEKASLFTLPKEQLGDGTLHVADKKGTEYTYMYRFTPGLVGAVLGVISLFFGIVSSVATMIGGDMQGVGYLIDLICASGAGVAGVFALILGIRSICAFRIASREANVKPIAALILGIAGTAVAAVALLITSAAFLLIFKSVIWR